MSKALKSSYATHHKIETFFTGSYIVFEKTGDHFFCSNGPFINKVSILNGQVVEQIGTDHNPEDNIIGFALTSNNKLLLIAHSSGLITKFNLEERLVERQFKSIHNAPVTVLKTDPNNGYLATGSSDGTVKLWNLNNHYCSHNLKGVNGVITCIDFYEHDDKMYLICTGGDDAIHIFDLDESKRVARLTSHCSTITDLKIHSNTKQMFSVGRDKIAVVWNIDFKDQNFGKSMRTIPLYESIESVIIIESEQYGELLNADVGKDIFLATAGEHGIIKLWDPKTGAKVFTQNSPPLSLDRTPGHPCFQLCERPNNEQICAISSERDIFMYDLPRLHLSQQLQGHIDEIFSVCWLAKDKYIALACNSNDLKLIDIETSKCQHLKGHNDITLCVKSVPVDPYLLISSSKDCSILIWQLNPNSMKPSIIYNATGHTHAVHSLGVLLSERTFFSGGEDTTLKRWSFEAILSSGPENDPNALIARQTIKAHEQRVDTIAISPNDQLVATGSRDKTARIFSVVNMQILATLKGHKRGVNAIQFSPVDQVIVTAADMNLRMWNLSDFSCVKTFQGHDCAVLNFTFLSTGLQLLSLGSDGNMKIWNVKSNDCSKTIDAHSGATWALSMTTDDQMVVTGGQDEKLIIWRDVTKEEREEKLANLQKQVVQEQNFMNYINKKKWRKALEIAINIENERKTLNVVREILLESRGLDELERILVKRNPEQINFIIECCVIWISTAKNSSIGQQVLYILVKHLNHKELLQLPSLTKSLKQLRDLTEKSFHRFERLAREATFVDFFLNATRI